MLDLQQYLGVVPGCDDTQASTIALSLLMEAFYLELGSLLQLFSAALTKAAKFVQQGLVLFLLHFPRLLCLPVPFLLFLQALIERLDPFAQFVVCFDTGCQFLANFCLRCLGSFHLKGLDFRARPAEPERGTRAMQKKRKGRVGARRSRRYTCSINC